MPPDLNSLPSSRTPSLPGSPIQHHHPPRRSSVSNNGDAAYRPSPPSPRSPSLSSLQATAAINAGLHRANSNVSSGQAASRLERRRSSLMNNLLIHDPTMPSPGETQQATASHDGSPRSRRMSSLALNTADPNHHRQPSLGELHQELENEQEAQVNRLLHMIRIQQDQLIAFQRSHPDATPTSPHSTSAIIDPSSPPASAVPVPHSQSYFNRPSSQSRHTSSRQSIPGTTTSRGTSPALRPVSGGLGPLSEDFLLSGSRDESAFYQAETQMLTRENQMLKFRIRELERQIAEMGSTESTQSGTPQVHANSPLASPPATFAGEPAPPVPATVDPGNKTD